MHVYSEGTYSVHLLDSHARKRMFFTCLTHNGKKMNSILSIITQERHPKDKCIFTHIQILGCFDVRLPTPLTCFLLVLTASPNPPQQITV